MGSLETILKHREVEHLAQVTLELSLWTFFLFPVLPLMGPLLAMQP